MSKDKLHFTTHLRKNQTPWEAKLWYYLRAKRFKNLKLRRQVRIEGYIVDFLCLSKKLIIELDGGQHNTEIYQKGDKIRQRALETKGFKVLRFWNNDIDSNIEGVLQEILENTVSHASPVPRYASGHPLPNGRG